MGAARLRLLVICVSAALANAAPGSTSKETHVNPAQRIVKELESKEIKLGEDEPGCKDPALLPRFPGCSVIQCNTREYDTLELQVGATGDGDPQREVVDGSSEIVYYLCPARLKLEQIVRQSESALSKAGFKALFAGKDGDEMPVATLQKDDQLVQVSTYVYNDYHAYIFTSVRLAAEPAGTAEAMADAIRNSGKVVVAGIEFKDESAEFTSESEKSLNEIAALLTAQPDLKLRIEVHTDNLEGPQTSQQITEKRAAAVLEWLAAHGVDKTRCTALGLGSSRPVADNNTDEGRARNRRVELAKL